jgi:3-oxoadipate CoA-transferase beta subunit
MDLAIGAKQVFVMMTLFTKSGAPKLVPECTYPLTGVQCVRRVYSDYGVFVLGPDGVAIRETYGIPATELCERLGLPA